MNKQQMLLSSAILFLLFILVACGGDPEAALNYILSNSAQLEEMVATIRQTLLQRKVIFFREQALTSAQHVAFARRFGERLARRLCLAG